jgi:hypothetical protein
MARTRTTEPHFLQSASMDTVSVGAPEPFESVSGTAIEPIRTPA